MKFSEVAKALLLSGALLSSFAAFGSRAANAGTIKSPINAQIINGGPGFGSILDTVNQSGLSNGFNSGVDDFDIYLSSNPTHTQIFNGFEWFSNSSSSMASIVFDLGEVFNVDRMALWNEESSGIGNFNIGFSEDGINFQNVLAGYAPTDNPIGSDYPAEVINLGGSARFIALDAFNCPQGGSGFPACAIGEVAFDVNNSAAAVPTPALLPGLIGMGIAAIRKRKGESAVEV